MAKAPEKVTIENIDLLLETAEEFYADLSRLQHCLNSPRLEESRRAKIESRCKIKFGAMMDLLYSVLDQSYYFLFCHFQNDGYDSFGDAASEIKQPLKKTLKWSENSTRDGHPECKGKRNKWITEQCKKIFGHNCPKHIRLFQENMLQLQAMKKVDQSGKEVPGPNGGPTLVRACNIQHDAAGNGLQFSPSSVSFKELKSVQNMDDWDETTIFNLHHFFRNVHLHKHLITCYPWDGYFNLETGEFRPSDQQLPEPWVFERKFFWISVPELSLLRQTGDERLREELKFYPHQLLKFCHKVLTFVKMQKRTLCHFVGCECQDDVLRLDMSEL